MGDKVDRILKDMEVGAGLQRDDGQEAGKK